MVGGGGCGGGGPLCRNCGAGGSAPLGEVGKMLSGAAVGAGAGTPAALAARAAPAPAPCPGRPRRGRVPPPLWLRLRRVGSAVSGHPHTHAPRVPRRAHPKLAVAERRPDKLPSPTPRPEGPGLWTPWARRRLGDPETFLSAVRAKGGLDREGGRGGLDSECVVVAAAPQVGPGTAPPNLEPRLLVEGGQGAEYRRLAFAQPEWGKQRSAPRLWSPWRGCFRTAPPPRSPGSARSC